MKNKILASLTVLCAALVLVGGFSVTAYAQTPTEETDDSGVIVETEPQPLTPEGNMTLVDDIAGESAGDKQFITVVTKGGNYFYIIIDRAEDGENTVHFLNQVDERDLLALMDEETPTVPVCTCKEKCAAGAVDTSCSVCKTNLSECAGREKVRDPEPEPEQPEKKSGSGLLAVVALLVLAGGGAFTYVKLIKPNRSSVKVSADPDEYDFPDEEYINEDEPAEAETEAEHE